MGSQAPTLAAAPSQDARPGSPPRSPGCVQRSPRGLHRPWRPLQEHEPERRLHATRQNAAKLATQIAFEEDESLTGVQAVRPARRASVYVPTFFTSEPQPNVADASLPQLQRINRQTQQVNLPLYYNAYRAPNQQVVYQ